MENHLSQRMHYVVHAVWGKQIQTSMEDKACLENRFSKDDFYRVSSQLDLQIRCMKVSRHELRQEAFGVCLLCPCQKKSSERLLFLSLLPEDALASTCDCDGSIPMYAPQAIPGTKCFAANSNTDAVKALLWLARSHL